MKKEILDCQTILYKVLMFTQMEQTIPTYLHNDQNNDFLY